MRRNRKPVTIAVAISLYCLLAAQAMAQELTDRSQLTGDWGGTRSLLEKKGITIEMVYTGEVVSILSGGEETPSSLLYLDNLDFIVTADTQKAGLWENGLFFFYGLSNHGDNPSEYIGDLQVTSNIEAYNSTRVFELWYEHSFLDGDFTVLGGLHDLNSEFASSDYASLFNHSSFGIQPDISANIPVPIFNVASVGLRVKAQPIDRLTVLAAVYDGDPGSPEKNVNGLHITIDERKEGYLGIGEINLSVGGGAWPVGVYKLGGWSHSGRFERFKTGEMVSGNSGVYALFDQAVIKGETGRAIGIFGQVGFAQSDRSEVSYYYGAGINCAGLIPSRSEDVFGIGTARAKISDDLVEVERATLGRSRTSEIVWEFIYRAQITPWLVVQPDFQIVENPKGDPNTKTAHVLSARVELSF